MSNLSELRVSRAGTCLPGGALCQQIYSYDWDEVGRLVRSRRYDIPGNALGASTSDRLADVDLSHYYDASDQRVTKRSNVGSFASPD